MVERRNRQDGSAFLGCTRFPACKGTRALTVADNSPAPARVRRRAALSDGGRPKTFADDVELIAARIVGHTLGPVQAVVLRVVLVVVVVALFIALTPTIATWFGHFFAGLFTQQFAPLASP
jgi:hypothetical protein